MQEAVLKNQGQTSHIYGYVLAHCLKLVAKVHYPYILSLVYARIELEGEKFTPPFLTKLENHQGKPSD